ncbi:unnamed protein product [Durusdinium trenchii]|uniref:SAM domain-containing protein n=1 Tax=Durusdinium trenchii TaxID=1381693 RepID=A0ABP0MQJ3_9DINO
MKRRVYLGPFSEIRSFCMKGAAREKQDDFRVYLETAEGPATTLVPWRMPKLKSFEPSSALSSLGLGEGALAKFQALGVRELAEDLEEIGLTRLQVRRLQALAKEAQKAAQEAAQAAAQEAPQEAAQEATQEAAQEATQEAAQEAAQEAQETQAALAGESADPAGESRTPPESEEHKELDIEAPPPPPPPRRPLDADALGGFMGALRRRSSSPPAIRRRSLSVRFRSVSSSAQGYEFEANCRREILEWMDGWACELSPKALGIQCHDCDLVLKLSFGIPRAGLLPKFFRFITPTSGKCQKESLLFFEMKSRARQLDHALEQLRTRKRLAEEAKSVPEAGLHLLALVALAKSDVEGRRTLQRWAERAQAEEGDLSVVVVDPEDWSLEAKERRARRIPKVPRGTSLFNNDYYQRKLETEDRQVYEGRYLGVVQVYKEQQAFGYLCPKEPQNLPLEVQRAVRENKGRALYFRGADLTDGTQCLRRGSKVEFQVYRDNHSAGACNISMALSRWP